MIVNLNRKIISTEACSLNIEYETLASAVAKLQEYINLYGADATISMHCEQYSNSDTEYMYVMIDVPETDAQMAARIAQESEQERQPDARELAQYKRLQEKFGVDK